MQLGEVIRAAGIGEVVESRCDAYAVGDVVTTLSGFQEYAIVRDDVFCTPVTGMDVIDQLAVMSIYGPTGATAYFGMNDIGRPQAGETVVVSAAAGATGSVAGQIAKIAGARVVGIAGGPEKCRAVVEDFGFDACIDYRAGDLAAALKEHCPRGVDVYFDNVGGPILDAVLGRLAPKARVVLCGVISSYLTGEHPGPGQLRQPPGEDRDDAGLQRARRVGPVRRGLRRAARWEQRACWSTARPSTTASSRASTPSTACSPAPTSARCWCGSRNPLPAPRACRQPVSFSAKKASTRSTPCCCRCSVTVECLRPGNSTRMNASPISRVRVSNRLPVAGSFAYCSPST